MAALAISLTGDQAQDGVGTMQLTAPAEVAGLIDQLRDHGVTITYDPDTQTISTGGSDTVAVTAGRDR